MIKSNLILLAFYLCALIGALSVHPLKTLVLYDERLTELNEYSKFFKSLKDRSYELLYQEIGNNTESIPLFDKEDRLYDNLVVFPVKGKHLNKLIPVKSFLQFYENGGDILTVTNPDAVTDSVRFFLNELGVYPSPKDYVLTDYFEDIPEKVSVSSENLLSNRVYSVKEKKDFVFQNSGAALLDNREQIVPILKAPRRTSTELKNKESWTVGSQGFLVAGFQNLVNARSVWVGSQDFFKNHYYNINGEFIEELTKWNFREKGVIKSSGATHTHSDGTSYSSLPYKIKDTVIYEIGLSEWTGEKWVPFIANDIQFELSMVDPYYRLTLQQAHKDETTQYYTSGEFKLPDHHGVFTFSTNYKREGLTFVSESDVKAIRHLANDEYPRSWEITNAWVYISSIYGIIGTWVIFVIFFVVSSKRHVSVEKKNN
ncbi:hypothetical protein Kpol_499p21 [Vanderwaltozyma polyspora DSM 70294]|uniref:Dolichyl-diphosphooligosaccharide--protein glycosyltransferase subunit WBP1 n=1 Tax=Vanderwaltozyma polyspora (strain ATCC 22028 / DSM 70294 / BCRC 21397 / CBS 2163 / NBRC 10782 / NRRL Y-8283 / UCD 57-17) TaxID=436907 RepID=A7TP24_VANPO|nr:uncharacterized protein Kpol_499p21 [Vanderwaltozyma polyspora DSM 70294]EDO15993.1 hypothetical protein Kpol_499p21 [Vanderwaltozyma polyspora DSM 70294]